MSAPFTIRPAQVADAPGLAGLLQGIGWFASYQTGTPDTHAAQLTPLLTASDQHLQLVAVNELGDVLAYCAVHWLPLAILQGWEGYVSELFVADSARGIGMGTQLLEKVTIAAREKGCKRLWLVNNRDRDSYQRHFYAQQGWQEQPQAARFVRTL